MQTLGLIPVASEKQNSGDRVKCVGLELKPEQHGGSTSVMLELTLLRAGPWRSPQPWSGWLCPSQLAHLHSQWLGLCDTHVSSVIVTTDGPTLSQGFSNFMVHANQTGSDSVGLGWGSEILHF